MTNIFRTRPKPDTSDGQHWVWCRFYYHNGDVQDALINGMRMLEIWDAMRAKIPIDTFGPKQAGDAAAYHLIRVQTKGLTHVQVLGTSGTQRQTTGVGRIGRQRATTIANNRRTGSNPSR